MQVPFQNIIYVENLKDKEMEYISWFVGWFLQNFTSENISIVQLVATMGLASMVAVYLFFVYRLLARKTIYSLRYNIMIAAMVLVITAIIFSVQSSIVLSLGVMGALSIVRFRSAVKEPLDIVFLFWSVTAGICIGAHMSEIAIILSGILTILIFSLEEVSVNRRNKILFVECETGINTESMLQQIEGHCKFCKLKRQNEEKQMRKIVMEVKCKDEYGLVKSIYALEGIKGVSLVYHEGEHSF